MLDKIESNISGSIFPALFISVTTFGWVLFGNKLVAISILYGICLVLYGVCNWIDGKLYGFRLLEIWSCCSIFIITAVSILIAMFSQKRLLVILALFSCFVTSFLFYYFCKLYFVYDAAHKEELLLVKLQNAFNPKALIVAWVICRDCRVILDSLEWYTPPHKYKKHIYNLFATELIPQIKEANILNCADEINRFIFFNLLSATQKYKPWSRDEYYDNHELQSVCVTYLRDTHDNIR